MGDGCVNKNTRPPWLDKEKLTGRVDDIAYKHKLSPRPADASRENGPKAYAHIAHDPEGLHEEVRVSQDNYSLGLGTAIFLCVGVGSVKRF